MVFILAGAANAATLQGTVYDFSLNKVGAAVVQVNTTPVQRAVTEQGKYVFNIPKGSYEVTASQVSQGVILSTTKETLQITDEGIFTLDMILFPEIIEDLDETPLEQPSIDEPTLFETQEDPYFFLYRALWVILLILIIWGGYHWIQNQMRKRQTGDLPDELVEIISIIRKQGGRMTQKDLRKELSHSEAKVSLMIDDLVAQKKIKKIKKGRGNILILT